jgi:outer membrane protein
MGAVDDALVSAREQLRLAEQRYATGVGNIIELVDAQVAYTSAAAQVVQARYGLATARAQLLAALGRS